MNRTDEMSRRGCIAGSQSLAAKAGRALAACALCTGLMIPVASTAYADESADAAAIAQEQVDSAATPESSPIAAAQEAAADSAVEAVSQTGHSVDAYREAQYNEPPDGDASDAGQHVKATLAFDGAVQIADADALHDSIVFWCNSQANSSFTSFTVEAEGNTLVLDGTVGFAIMGGNVGISAASDDGILAGVTVDGAPVKLAPVTTTANTGLEIELVEAVKGTADSPAHTTYRVTHGANVRSMNHMVWMSNGSGIIEGAGTAQTTAAHHHTWYNFTHADSAESIASNAEGSVPGYTVTSDGDEFTIAADVATAGEVVSAAVYNDAFLQANGLTLTSPVTGVAVPDASDPAPVQPSIQVPAKAIDANGDTVSIVVNDATASWLAAEKTVSIDGKAIDPSLYTIAAAEDGTATITFKTSAFGDFEGEKTFNVQIEDSTGYAMSVGLVLSKTADDGKGDGGIDNNEDGDDKAPGDQENGDDKAPAEKEFAKTADGAMSAAATAAGMGVASLTLAGAAFAMRRRMQD